MMDHAPATVALFAPLGAIFVLLAVVLAHRLQSSRQLRLGALAATSAFSALPPKTLHRLARLASAVKLRPGQLVQRKGAPVVAVVVVVSGRVQASDPQGGGARRVWAAGDCLGVTEALADRAAAAERRAVEPSVVLRLSSLQLRKAMRTDPGLEQRMRTLTGLPRQQLRAEGTARTALVRLLRGPALFDSLNLDELEALAERARLRHVPAGTPLVREGRAVRAIHFILEGELRVQRRGRWVNHMVPGDYFGEIGVLSGAAAGHTVVSVTPARVAMLNWTALAPAIQRHPAVGLHLLDTLTGRLANDRGLRRRPYVARLSTAWRRLIGRRTNHPPLCAGDWDDGSLGNALSTARRRGPGPGWRIDPLGLTPVDRAAPPSADENSLDIDRSQLSAALAIQPRLLPALAHHAVFALPEVAARTHASRLLRAGASPTTTASPLPTTQQELSQMHPLIRRMRKLKRARRGLRLARTAVGLASKKGVPSVVPVLAVVKLRKKRRRRKKAKVLGVIGLRGLVRRRGRTRRKLKLLR